VAKTRSRSQTHPTGRYTLRSQVGPAGSRRAGRPRRPQLALGLLEDRSLPSFLAPVNWPAATNPAAVAVGNFNSGTVPDMVVANWSDSSVSVLIGNGDGTFQAPINSATGTNPGSIAVGDFNGDGKMDVATANGGDVSVLIGNGNGTFQAPVNISVGDSPSSVATGDFNGDGKIDLGVTSNTWNPGWWGYYGYYPGWYDGRASVLIGNGAGSFAPPSATYLGTGFHSGAAAEDFNGDGRDDFATGNLDYGSVAVAIASTTGTLQGASYYNGGWGDGSVAAADISGDGKADIVTANRWGDNVSVLLGDGLGGFAATQYYAAGVNPVAVALGDFNAAGGDGKVDIAVSTGSGNGVTVLLGLGNGVFSPGLPSESDAYLSGVAVGDFNGDGWQDAAASNDSGNSASVFTNDITWPPLDAPTLSITDASVTEGNSGSITANFTVSLSAAYNLPVTVHYSTADSSATATDGDYAAVSGDLTFAPGDLTKTIPITVFGDRKPEWDEAFSIRLSAPTNAFVSDPLGWGTIRDDEPTVNITSWLSGNEGNTGTTAFNFEVTLSADYDSPVSVDFATRDLTPDEEYWYGPAATAGVDYVARTDTLTFAAHEQTKYITILVNGDRTGEPDELFWVGLTSSDAARMGYTQALGSIVDDEPTISINSGLSVKEGHTGTTNMRFTVTLSNPSDLPVTVDFSTADGSATVAGGDYTATSGTVTINPGNTTGTIDVPIKGDRVGEWDEYLYVNLSNPTGADITSGSGYGYIQDDEPKISINSPAAIKEGNNGTKLLTFTVTLSVAYDQPVTVNYATHDYSATAGTDYVATSGMLTFAAGQTTKTFTVQIKGDKKKESNESFYVELSAPSTNAFISNSNGWGTILDDDGPHRR